MATRIQLVVKDWKLNMYERAGARQASGCWRLEAARQSRWNEARRTAQALRKPSEKVDAGAGERRLGVRTGRGSKNDERGRGCEEVV